MNIEDHGTTSKRPKRRTRVFISYSSKNRQQARKAQSALEDGGFEVWRDERKIEIDWSAEIAKGLAQADVLCLLWTKEAAGSDFVKKEWLTARALEKSIIPCLFPDAPPLPTPIENLQGVVLKNGHKAVHKLTEHFLSRTTFLAEYDFRAPHLRGYVPFAPDDRFTGRKQDLLAVYLAMVGQLNKIGINRLGVVGMGGLGKTELVVEFAYRFEFGFDGIYWIQGNDKNQLSADVVSLARDVLRLKIAHPERADASTNFLLKLLAYSKAHPQMLVIVDNVMDADILLDAGALPGGKFSVLDLGCNVLFTTRKQFKLTGVQQYLLNPLSPEAALDLLTRGRCERFSPEDAKFAGEICNAVGYLPLALALIGAYLRSYPKVTPGRYLEILRKNNLGAIDATKIRPNELATRHEAAVETTLRSQWKTLRDPNARLVLKIAAHFPQGTIIPANRIGLLAGSEDKKSDVELPLAHALNALQQFSLISTLENGSAVRVHPLVSEFVHNLVSESTRTAFLTGAATKLNAALQDPVRLNDEYESRGIQQVIDDLEVAVSWSKGNRPLGRQLELLRRLLDRERSNLGQDAGQTAQLKANLFQQLHQRAAIMGLSKSAATYLKAGLSIGCTMLRLRASTAVEDPALVRTFLKGHSNLMAVGISADGRRLVTGSGNREVVVWDVSNGQILRTLKHHTSIITSVAISPDGLRALSGGWDKKLICWDLATGKRLWQGRDHADEIYFVAMTGDGSKALSGSLDKTMILWDVASGGKIAHLKGHKRGIVEGSLSRDGKYAISADSSGSVAVWDLQQESLLYRFELDTSADGIRRDVTALCFTQDAKFAAIATGYGGSVADYFGPDREGRLLLWDVAARRVVRHFAGHSGPVNAIVFTSDGLRLLSGSSDKTVKLWEVSEGLCQRTFLGHAAGIRGISITPDDRFAISGGWEGTAILWELDSSNGQMESQSVPLRPVGHALWVRSADISGDGTTAVTSSDDHSVTVWSVESGTQLATLNGHDERVNSVKLSSDSANAVSGDHNGTLILWHIGKREILSKIETGRGRIHAVNLSPDKRMVLAGSYLGWTVVWDVESKKMLEGFNHPERLADDDSDGITAILVSNNGRSMISAAEDSKKILRWDIGTVAKMRNSILNVPRELESLLHKLLRKKQAVFKGHSGGVLALDHNHDDTRLLSGSLDCTAILWDSTNQQSLLHLEGHTSPVNNVAFATDRLAVTTSFDNSLILWNLESGKPLSRLYFQTLMSAMAARSNRIVAGDRGGAVYFFEIEEPKTRHVSELAGR